MLTVLAVDIGSSSLKAALFTEDGTMLGFGRSVFLFKSTDHAAREWLPALKDAVAQIRKSSLAKVDSICISGNGPTVVSLDSSTLLWNEEFSAPPHPTSLFLPRVQAFKNKFPESWKNSRFILSGPEYLAYLLTGVTVTFLPEKRFERAYWNDLMLNEEGFEDEKEKFPPFVFSGSKVGVLKKNASEELSLLEGTPVFAGAPDFVSALVGTNTLTPGSLCDRAGSSEGINLCTESAILFPGVRTLPSCVESLWNASVLIPRSGSRFSELKLGLERECGHALDFSSLVDSLLFEVREHLSGGKKNISSGAELLLEIALSVKNAVEILKNASLSAGLLMQNSMTVTGRQSSIGSWNQLKANVTGLCVNVLSVQDSELTGDAVFALFGMGVFPSVKAGAQALCRIQKTFVPE